LRHPLTLVAALSIGTLGLGSARAGTSDSCPILDPTLATTTPLSISYPAEPTLVGPSVAQPAALVDSGGSATGYLVEYGPSTDYGLCTPVTALPPASGPQPILVTLTGLTPATTYHFRVVASSDAGSAAGVDQVFTTLAAGQLPQDTTIDGIAVGGLKKTAALTAVRRLVATPARLAVGAQRWSVPRARLGARLAVTPALSAALAGLPGQKLTVPISVDRKRLATYLRAAARRYGKAPQPAAVRLVGTHAVVSTARPGVQIAPEHARSAIAAYLRGARKTVLHLPTRVAPAPRTGEKAVVIRLESQSLSAYQNGKLVLRTPVTTGRLALPTPVGSYSVQSRYSPYTFISPWPEGSPYYYPPTPVTWAMYFYDNDFLHDDPAEPTSAYGPGSQNGPYASHGCVHVPHDAMAFLYRWLPIGAKVIVSQT
jgi:lipoprotein-anchoring transpeptidase ErfK/SrfK